MTTNTSTREAHLALEKAVTKEDVLRLIPQFELKSFFRRHYLKREVIIGLIGLRGDVKSGSGASISLIDYMIEGIPVHSNMDIHCDLEIDDKTARKYDLNSGGVARYESIPLDKEALLKFDPKFRRSLIFGDEINMELAESRRAMSNTNLWFSNVGQELRKLESSMIYTVIDEMFIDPRLRTLTDIFIKSEDTAFSIEGLTHKKQPGIDAKWIIYPMSGYLVGRENSYYITKKPLPPVFFHFSRLWGIYDDKQLQATYKAKYGVIFKKKDEGEIKGTLSLDSDAVDERYDEWGWLAEKAQLIKNSGVEYLEAYQLWQILGIVEHGFTPYKMGRVLPAYGIHRHHQTKFGQWVYRIENFNIEDLTNKQAVAIR